MAKENEITQEEIAKFKEEIHSKLYSFQNSSDRLDFIAVFHSSIDTIGNNNPLRMAWEEEIRDYYLPKQPNGELDKNTFEQRVEEIARWQQQKALETGELVQNLPEGHSDDWITDNVHQSKQSIMNATIRDGIVFATLDDIEKTKDLFAKAYPEYPLGQVTYASFLKQSTTNIANEMNEDIKQLYKTGKAYINGNYAEDLVNEPILAALTAEEKKAATERKQEWQRRQQELSQKDTLLSEEELQKEQMHVNKEIWDHFDFGFLSNATIIGKLRENQNKELRLHNLKGAQNDFIEQINYTEELLDGMKIDQSTEYESLRTKMTNLKNALFKAGAIPEYSSQVKTAEKDFIKDCSTYLQSLPKNAKDYNRPLVQLMQSVQTRQQTDQLDAWNSSVQSFNSVANELQARSGQRKGFWGNKKEDSEEYTKILNSIKRLHKTLDDGNVDSDTFQILTTHINNACTEYLNTKKDPGSKEGKERYALVQDLWYANKRITEQQRDTFTQNNITLGAPAKKSSEQITHFKEDIKNKLDSFQNPMEKMEFIASFSSFLAEMDSPYKTAFNDIMYDYFLPRNPDGNLNKSAFENRLDELVKWSVQKKLEVGQMVGITQKIHSDDWIADKIFTTKPSFQSHSITNFLVAANLGMDSHTEKLLENAYPGGITFLPSLLLQKEEDFAAKQDPKLKEIYQKGKFYINGNLVEAVKDEEIEAAKTEEEKEKLREEKMKWKQQQKELKAIEKMIPRNEKEALQERTKKDIWDSLDLSFLRDNAIIKELRKKCDNYFEKSNLKVANKDFLEQIEQTEKLLDEMDITKNNEYQNMRDQMNKIKDTLDKYGTSPEHTKSVRAAQKTLADSCRKYMDSLPKNTLSGNYVRPVAQLMEAATENAMSSRENAWDSAMGNFNTLADELQAKSGQRKGTFGGTKEDSSKYSAVLNAVKAFRDEAKKGSIKTADFRKLNDDIRKSCDEYLRAKNPGSKEGKERYALIQKIWNANSRLSSHYADTTNPFGLKADLEAIQKRKSILEAQKKAAAEAKKNIQELKETQNTNNNTKRRNSIATISNRPRP